MERRDFLNCCAAASADWAASTLEPARASGRTVAANDRVRIGWIGCGGRGTFVARCFHELADAQIAAVCNVYQPNAEKAKAWLGSKPDVYGDFRRVLDRNNVDAVLIATPDHWHAIPTVLACQAGKDVYVEKPLGHNVAEGQAMVEAVRRHERIVQTGTQQRSAAHFHRIREIIQSGQLGAVKFVRIWNYSNLTPGGIACAPTDRRPRGSTGTFTSAPHRRCPSTRNGSSTPSATSGTTPAACRPIGLRGHARTVPRAEGDSRRPRFARTLPHGSRGGVLARLDQAARCELPGVCPVAETPRRQRQAGPPGHQRRPPGEYRLQDRPQTALGRPTGTIRRRPRRRSPLGP